MLAPNGRSSNTAILAMHGIKHRHFSHHDLFQCSPAMGFQRNYSIMEPVLRCLWWITNDLADLTFCLHLTEILAAGNEEYATVIKLISVN